MAEGTVTPTNSFLLAGVFALLGTIFGGLIEGYWDVQLAYQQLNSKLVMRALESDSSDERLAALYFMIQTKLIKDKDIGVAVTEYIKDVKSTHKLVPKLNSKQERL